MELVLNLKLLFQNTHYENEEYSQVVLAYVQWREFVLAAKNFMVLLPGS